MALEHVAEYLDVLSRDGAFSGTSKLRALVHRDGDYHRAVHVWLYAESTGQLLLQKRAEVKDSWPGLWDISSAGHISAGDTSLFSAQRELEEELGLIFPDDAFELLFVFLQECVTNGGTFINNEYNDVYLVTTVDPIPLEAFTLQDGEVSAVKYMAVEEYREALRRQDPAYVPYDADSEYHQLFSALEARYKVDPNMRMSSLRDQLSRYVPVSLVAETSGLSKGDIAALAYTIRTAQVIDHIFFQQLWRSNPDLKAWLEERREQSELDRLKLSYFNINKGPWSVLDDNEAFLTTADSAIKVVSASSVAGFGPVAYKAAFPVAKPPGANFYPPDVKKEELELWMSTLDENEKQDATGFFTVIRRAYSSGKHSLQTVKFSDEYKAHLEQAAQYLRQAASCTDTPSLKRLLETKAAAFLSNDYYESDAAWIELDSAVDVTIGPYETYEDRLFCYKATFESFIGVRDHVATEQVKLFSKELQNLEDNLPFPDEYKSKGVRASPIRVIQLLYNSGDVKGPQTVAFNLPNDEKIVKEKGSAMVMLKNVSQSKFQYILLPIAEACISESQRHYVNFDSFFTHTVCHECCHGLGPHTITLPDGRQSTVRRELQELHSALEEAKADIVGLWALQHLVDRGLLSSKLEKSMYVSFLAGCFRSVRFGLEEAHGKGQALQFNWILGKGGFVQHSDGTFSVAFDQIKEAVRSLCCEVLVIQAQGDKPAARGLLSEFGITNSTLKAALGRIEAAKVPVDIAPSFRAMDGLLA